ncbi:hypothetical protein HG530_002108 [Fusarium avenaceum]|nr:hypothetical protein HG530_002108 [Fusarium avenaceum]
MGRRLEWAALGARATNAAVFGLLNAVIRTVAAGPAVGLVEIHETVSLLTLLLTSPDSPGHEAESADDNGTANADNNANNGVASLGRHAGRAVIVVVGAQSRSCGGHTRSGHSLKITIAVGSCDDGNMGRSNGLSGSSGLLIICSAGGLIFALAGSAAGVVVVLALTTTARAADCVVAAVSAGLESTAVDFSAALEVGASSVEAASAAVVAGDSLAVGSA